MENSRLRRESIVTSKKSAIRTKSSYLGLDSPSVHLLTTIALHPICRANSDLDKPFLRKRVVNFGEND